MKQPVKEVRDGIVWEIFSGLNSYRRYLGEKERNNNFTC